MYGGNPVSAILGAITGFGLAVVGFTVAISWFGLYGVAWTALGAIFGLANAYLAVRYWHRG